jgi:hypothetical protein
MIGLIRWENIGKEVERKTRTKIFIENPLEKSRFS